MSSTTPLSSVSFASRAIDIGRFEPTENQGGARDQLVEHYASVIPMEAEELRVLMEKSIEDAFALVELPGQWRDDLRQRFGMDHSTGDDAEPGEQAVLDHGDTESPTDVNLEILLSGINDVTNLMMGEKAISEILFAVLETLYRGMGAHRVLLFINNSKRREFSVRYGFAPDLDAIKGSFTLTAASGKRIVESLATRADLVVADTVSETAAGGLSDVFGKALGISSFALFPVVVGEKLIAAIYLDSQLQRTINARECELIASLRNQVALAIKMYS